MNGRAAPAPLLEVKGVTLQYKTKEHLVTATYRVDFQVYKSDRFVILGPSGCGKSTLLKAVGGYMPPVEGTMSLNGEVIRKPGADRVFVFQEFDQLLPWKTVKQNVMFALTASGKLNGKAAEDKAMHYIEKVKLTQFADSFPHTLSGGMKQRVAIARGMAMEPDILLMDEPFAALDALTRRKMQEELLQLWDDTHFTVLFVTHSIPEAVLIGNRILLLSPHPGRVKAELNSDGRDHVGVRRQEALGAHPRHAVCRPDRRGGNSPWLNNILVQRPEFVREVEISAYGVVEKPLTAWEKIFNNAAVRKCLLLLMLATIWQVYSTVLDNPLLFPQVQRHHRRVLRQHHERRAAAARLVLDQGPVDGLWRGIISGRHAHRLRDHLAHRQRLSRNADLDVQSAAGHRAAAAGADLVRPRQRQPGVRADPLGAVAGRAQHALGLHVGIADDAHGRPQLRP